jgi:hypothetical protein
MTVQFINTQVVVLILFMSRFISLTMAFPRSIEISRLISTYLTGKILNGYLSCKFQEIFSRYRSIFEDLCFTNP